MTAGGLDRFVDAQRSTYDRALAELHAGAKQSHWMWFVFPQIAGLGLSSTARFYAIADAVEAVAYLSHPILGTRLRECTDAMLGWAGRKTAEAILGPVDAMKFVSSMTLFDAVAQDDNRFARALAAFNHGERDPLTLELTLG
uniref:DUF1810 domain-containing protein n=1 Tax=Altererythrobacter segetis TaxID=1104773 RepID=UPI0014081AC7|nr:DUF1810 domain-containing protein [Altererythrobacter segetis]